jgi:microsomal dipeptidase-like Zn-dependent dipeptidase
MATFDLHCHPTLKSSMYQGKPSPFEQLEPTINFTNNQIINRTLSKLSKMLMGDPLSSQCSFGQIEGGSLIVVALIAFEQTYMKVKLPTGQGLLESIDEFDEELLADLNNNLPNRSYFDLFFTREIKHLTDFEGVVTDGKQYIILNTINDYPAQPDLNTIYVVVSVEGGHNFYTNPDIDQQEANPQSILDQFRDYKIASKRRQAGFPRIFYITPTHHAQNALVNHAWALPKGFTNTQIAQMPTRSFYPKGNKITAAGLEFIDIALTQDDFQDRILIDLKHQSLGSRKQFYDKYRGSDVPFVASHACVNGTSWLRPDLDPPLQNLDNLVKENGYVVIKYQPRGGFRLNVPQTNTPRPIYFNPWSINLYDEDILEIMNSGGLIGIELDRRVIGTQSDQDEYFSENDFPSEWVNNPSVRVNLYENTEDLDNDLASEDMLYFCQNVIHIVLITRHEQNNPTGNYVNIGNVNPWEQICMGSDFDGLITPIEGCETADKLSVFFENQGQMFRTLRKMAEDLDLGAIPADIIDKLKLENGLSFVRKHFI